MRIFDALRPHSRWDRQVDEYVDGELTPGRLTRFEAHLRTCRDCADAVAERGRMKQAIAAMPVAVPRSFRITSEMAAGAKVLPPATRPSQLAPRLSMALAALALVGLVSTVAVDVNRQEQGGGLSAADSTFAASAPKEAVMGSALAPAVAPSVTTPGSLYSQGIPSAGATSQSTPPGPGSGQKAALTRTPTSASTTDRSGLRLAEAGFAAFAVACAVASVFLVRKQRRTSS